MTATVSPKVLHGACESRSKSGSFESGDSQWDLDRWTTLFSFGFTLQVSDC